MNAQATRHYQLPNGRRDRRYVPFGLGIIALAMSVATAMASDRQETKKSIVEELQQTDSFFVRTSGSRLFNQLLEQGEFLSSDEVKALEKKLQQDPKDLPSRVVLMGYHKKIEGRHPPSMGPYGQLVLGIIKHHPRSQLSAETSYLLLQREGKMGDGEAWGKGSRFWLELVETHPSDPQIIGNSGVYHYVEIFRPGAQDQAIALLKRAHKLDPKNPRWVWYLGDIHSAKSRAFSTSEEQRQAFAKSALDYLEESFRLCDEQERSKLRGQSTLASAAFAAGEFEKAKTYATERLRSVNPRKERWNYGNVIHNMNVLLGRIALRQGNLEEAKQYLLKAGKSPGSPQLNSFGPELTFARELLEKGEKSVVIEYLELIGKFWANPENADPSNQNSLNVARENAQKLARWKNEILEDKIPQDRKWQATPSTSQVDVSPPEPLAYFRFNGNDENDGKGEVTLELRNTEFKNNALYLNGIYDLDNEAGARAVFRTPTFEYTSFSVAIRFKAEDFGRGKTNLFTGGRLYRWFGMNRSRATSLTITLNNQDFSHEFNEVYLEKGKWTVIACSVDIAKRKIVTYLNGRQLPEIELPADFRLSVIDMEKRGSDKVWSFANYSNAMVFHGLVDELLIYDQALNAEELEKIPLHVTAPQLEHEKAKTVKE